MAEVADEDLPTRWEIELEVSANCCLLTCQFVQSLANMQYLTYLAQTGFLEDEKFLNYLEYLEYWRRPEYAKQLVYPNCLHVLTMLKSPQFRKDIAKAELSSVLYNDMVERWKEPLREPVKGAKEDPGTSGQEQPQASPQIKIEDTPDVAPVSPVHRLK
ncbi:hypothetical protein KL907_003664 [Ogataea polymorpha]|nr:hypothetical protein KL907_003664 [Ogataea polymorpha]